MIKALTYSLFLAVGFASAAQATRVIEILERSHELSLAEVTLPQSGTGSVGYKACDDCARSYMPVTAETLYLLDGRAMTLAELRQATDQIRRAAGAANRTLVVLHYDPNSETATRVRVSQL